MQTLSVEVASVCGAPQLFQVQEDTKAAEQRVAKLQESLQRNKQWVIVEGSGRGGGGEREYTQSLPVVLLT